MINYSKELRNLASYSGFKPLISKILLGAAEELDKYNHRKMVIETKLRVLPKKCNKCKYSYLRYNERFCAVSFIDGMNRCCPYEYNEAKRNCEYGKPDWCPLKEIEPV